MLLKDKIRNILDQYMVEEKDLDNVIDVIFKELYGNIYEMHSNNLRFIGKVEQDFREIAKENNIKLPK